MDFMNSLMVSASGLRAQSGRMRIIAENIANAGSTGQTPEDDPYRRRIPTFKAVFDRELQAEVVQVGRIADDKSEFTQRYQPGHPAADENGYVRMPNVNTLIESVDMREAQRSYEANLNAVQATRSMVSGTLDILRV